MITTLHGTDITLVGRDPSYLPITRFGIEKSEGVTAVSQWLKEQTAKNFGTSKEIEVVPNFVDPARFKRTRGDRGTISGSLSSKKITTNTMSFFFDSEFAAQVQ